MWTYLAQSTNRGDTFQIEFQVRSVGFWGEEKTRVPALKQKDKNQQQTQPTYDAESGNTAPSLFPRIVREFSDVKAETTVWIDEFLGNGETFRLWGD